MRRLVALAAVLVLSVTGCTSTKDSVDDRKSGDDAVTLLTEAKKTLDETASVHLVLTGRDLLTDGNAACGWPLRRAPMLLETSLPGVFAAGDVRHRSIKRVAAAAGEGATAIQLIHEYLADESVRVRAPGN